MAQGDSVPSSNRQLITGEGASQSTKLPAVRVKPSGRVADLGVGRGLLHRYGFEAKTAGCPRARTSRHSPYVCRLLWNVLLIMSRFLSRNKRLHFSTFQNALKKTSSNQLVRSKPQERLK